jgi:Xaa-Pro aminopeptidase
MTGAGLEADRTTELDVAAVAQALGADELDGWLLYDFHGINPIAGEMTGAGRDGGHLATRRWFYFIPAAGRPRGLVHSIESGLLAHLPGTIEHYASRNELEAGLRRLLDGSRRIAMEYSPLSAIPYISRVDAGTIELVRQSGVDVVSSGDLVQRFSAVWHDPQMASHRRAAEKLYRVKDRAFEATARRVRDRVPTTEFDIQQLMVKWFTEEGLVTDSPPIVAAAEHAGNPHYLPTAAAARLIEPDELVLIDLWAKLDGAGSVFADITWVGHTGRSVPERLGRAFSAIRDARDRAVAFVRDGAQNGRDMRGWQVDRAAADLLSERGYASHILHRTGHSLGESVHGNGVNMDDYETHDDRRMIPGTGFTIEPGLYFPDFGVRTEINMIVLAHDAVVTGPLQTEILALV